MKLNSYKMEVLLEEERSVQGHPVQDGVAFPLKKHFCCFVMLMDLGLSDKQMAEKATMPFVRFCWELLWPLI